MSQLWAVFFFPDNSGKEGQREMEKIKKGMNHLKY